MEFCFHNKYFTSDVLIIDYIYLLHSIRPPLNSFSHMCLLKLNLILNTSLVSSKYKSHGILLILLPVYPMSTTLTILNNYFLFTGHIHLLTFHTTIFIHPILLGRSLLLLVLFHI